MADKDLLEKTLEDYNDVFSDIVNGLLFNGKRIISEQALIEATPVSMYKADGNLHEQERDVAKYWILENNKRINVRIAFLGIENQTVYDKDMPLRAFSYDGAAYRSELSTTERYPVITLILYFGDEPWGKNRSLYDVIDVPEILQPYVNDYRINVFEVAHFSDEQINCFHSDFRIVADFFAHRRANPDYRPENPLAFDHVDELLKLLAVITRDNRFTDTLDMGGGKPTNMCEVLDRVEAKGIEQGIELATLSNIKSLINGLGWTKEQAMDALMIPKEERAKYLAKL